MISVITPVYNSEQFIEACIKVVVNQACPNVEHIIIDGGSTDRTVEIIKAYAQNYSHIRWISEKDKGQSDAMNKGIAMAKGNVIAMLNVDDFYEPNVLNRVVEIFKTLPEPSLLVGNCNVLDDDDNLKLVNKPRKLQLANLLLGHRVNPFPINPSAYFYHTSLHKKIGLYQVDEHYAMDVDFLFRSVQVANVQYVDETWGNYRQMEGTKTVNDISSGQNGLRLKAMMKAYRKNLPLWQRLQVGVTYELYQKIFKAKYFLREPQKLPLVLKKKLVRIVSSS